MALSTKRPSKADTTKKKIMKSVIGGAESKKRLNAEVEESIYKKIKIQSAHEGRTVSEITRELWVEYLSKNSFE